MRVLSATALLLTASLAACAVMEKLPGGNSNPPPAPQRLDIPRGHYPPPGSCRIWIPGVAPGQQSAPGKCSDLEKRVPGNGVLVYG